MTPLRSRIRVATMKEPENRTGMTESRFWRDTDQKNLEGQQTSGSGQRATHNPTILNVERSHGGEK